MRSDAVAQAPGRLRAHASASAKETQRQRPVIPQRNRTLHIFLFRKRSTAPQRKRGETFGECFAFWPHLASEWIYLKKQTNIVQSFNVECWDALLFKRIKRKMNRLHLVSFFKSLYSLLSAFAVCLCVFTRQKHWSRRCTVTFHNTN